MFDFCLFLILFFHSLVFLTSVYGISVFPDESD